ncbi:MAG: hypothetical protein JOZ77_09430 [Candidatus Eremiobacteraeota bacterium]|nr:hypothetical protein [Candidatus Eremiobacteraeota bacterium]
MFKVRLWIALVLALVGCSHTARVTASHPPAGGRPRASVTAPSTPAASPAATSAATSTAPVVTPSSVSSASGKQATVLPPAPKKVARLLPAAAPQILGVAISETLVHPGDRVFGRVVTTSNVASVEARIGGYAVSLAKVGVGRFELTYTVGPLPWFVHGNFTMQVIAHNTRGDTVTRDVPLTVR